MLLQALPQAQNTNLMVVAKACASRSWGEAGEDRIMQTKGHRPRLFLLEATAKELDLGFRKILEEEGQEMDEGLNVLAVADAAWVRSMVLYWTTSV
jgi:hypothetical protein